MNIFITNVENVEDLVGPFRIVIERFIYSRYLFIIIILLYIYIYAYDV